MSSNLYLMSDADELPLVQTSTELTTLVASSGSQAVAVESYQSWLRGSRWEGFSWMAWESDCVPEWSWDVVTRHIAMVDAFLAFAPGARFTWS